jgi:hypothetical protein
MTRGLRWCLVGSCLLALAGCARMWFAEREPWRREAELACMKSGAVKEGSAVSFLTAIDGPGMCGADYPLRVAALGEPALVGFADEVVRPPGAIRGVPDDRVSAPTTPARFYPAPPAAAPGEPISLAPGLPRSDLPRPDRAPAGRTGGGATAQSHPPDFYPQQRAQLRRPPVDSVPLGRAASPAIAAGPAAVTPAATLACPLVSALDRFVSDSVQPAALRWFGQPVVEIRQISSYSCRGMNGDPSASISEHAFGNALDIAAFTLADGRKISVKEGWHGLAEEQGFLHDVQGAACEMFTTVLAPGSNAYHYDHMHVDLMRRTSGRTICQPAAIPGEAAAARAGGRYGAARQGEPPFTGSVAPRRYPRPASRLDEDPSLARAVPGQD